VPLRSLLNAPTVSALAEAIVEAEGAPAADPRILMADRSRADVEPPLRRGGDVRGIPRLEANERAPLSFAQERMWLLERMLPAVSAYNVPRLLRMASRLDEDALQQALDVVAARHNDHSHGHRGRRRHSRSSACTRTGASH